MSIDVKLLTLCDHNVNNRIYEKSQCPRCNSKGFYYDISFNPVDNQAVTCSGEIKFQQEILKVLLDKLKSNPFHPNWGNTVNTEMIGTKNLSLTQIQLQTLIYKVLNYLQNLQSQNQELYGNMTEDEIIQKIVSIDVVAISQTGYAVKVTLQSASGVMFEQELELS